MSEQSNPIDEARLNAFVGKMVTEISAAMSGALGACRAQGDPARFER